MMNILCVCVWWVMISFQISYQISLVSKVYGFMYELIRLLLHFSHFLLLSGINTGKLKLMLFKDRILKWCMVDFVNLFIQFFVILYGDMFCIFKLWSIYNQTPSGYSGYQVCSQAISSEFHSFWVLNNCDN